MSHHFRVTYNLPVLHWSIFCSIALGSTLLFAVVLGSTGVRSVACRSAGGSGTCGLNRCDNIRAHSDLTDNFSFGCFIGCGFLLCLDVGLNGLRINIEKKRVSNEKRVRKLIKCYMRSYGTVTCRLQSQIYNSKIKYTFLSLSMKKGSRRKGFQVIIQARKYGNTGT